MVRAFAAATGFSVMRYVRVRRLSMAARALAGRRARYSDIGAGCGLRLSRSIHPRVPRPFRRHARNGPRRNVPRPSQASGADRHGFNAGSTISNPRASKPGKRCSLPASANAARRRRRRRLPNQWQRFHQKVDNIPDRVGNVAYGLCCNGDDFGNFDYIAGVEVSDFSDLPREFSPRGSRTKIRSVHPHRSHLHRSPHHQHDLESLATGVRHEGGRRAELRALRREVRSGDRQWRAGDMDFSEGVGRSVAWAKRKRAHYSG